MLHVIMDQLENSAYNRIARYTAYMTIDTVAWLDVGAYTASNKNALLQLSIWPHETRFFVH